MNLLEILQQMVNLEPHELNQIKSYADEVKIMKAKASFGVGDTIYVVQKTKRTIGEIKKINSTRAIVAMQKPDGSVSDYNVPFAMMEKVA